MYKIIWSKAAETDYLENINFLLEDWTEKQVLSFINTVNEHLNLIRKNPEIFALTKYLHVRSVLIIKQIRLFYLSPYDSLPLYNYLLSLNQLPFRNNTQIINPVRFACQINHNLIIEC